MKIRTFVSLMDAILWAHDASFDRECSKGDACDDGHICLHHSRVHSLGSKLWRRQQRRKEKAA